MFIDLPPQTEQIIAQVAKQNGQSLQDFIVISAYKKPCKVWLIHQRKD